MKKIWLIIKEAKLNILVWPLTLLRGLYLQWFNTDYGHLIDNFLFKPIIKHPEAESIERWFNKSHLLERPKFDAYEYYLHPFNRKWFYTLMFYADNTSEAKNHWYLMDKEVRKFNVHKWIVTGSNWSSVTWAFFMHYYIARCNGYIPEEEAEKRMVYWLNRAMRHADLRSDEGAFYEGVSYMFFDNKMMALTALLLSITEKESPLVTNLVYKLKDDFRWFEEMSFMDGSFSTAGSVHPYDPLSIAPFNPVSSCIMAYHFGCDRAIKVLKNYFPSISRPESTDRFFILLNKFPWLRS